MELTELIEAVKAAKDKAELEALVKRELEIDLDKRKSLDTLRAEVLKGMGVEEGGEPGAGTTAGGASNGSGNAGGQQQDEPAPTPIGIVVAGAGHEALIQSLRAEILQLREDNGLLLKQLQAAQIQIQDLEVTRFGHGVSGGVTGDALNPPALDYDDEQPEPPAVDGVRLLRNTENGREFAWSPELAKLPHMKEV